jgi:NAD(P)-dependent dehydrogenase (short-subunit alcohol dehydrogenase family)
MTVVFGGGDIADAIGGTVLTKQDCDVRDYNSVLEHMVELKPSTVVVTAGVSHVADILRSDPNNWQEELEVNLLGSYHVAKAAAYAKVKNMVFIASVAGLFGKPNHSGYSASKGGVISLVESLAMEGYNAYAISPGRVDTKMRQHDYPNDKPGTRLEPQEIAEVVQDIIKGTYKSGDNIIIRRIGYETAPIKVDRNEQWRSELKVGEPVTL